MGKTFYDEYVNHMLRFYFRYKPNRGFKNDVDKTNYIAVDRVVKRLSDNDKQLLQELYSGKRPVGTTIRAIATRHNITTSTIWDLRYSVTIKIAKERRLL